MTPEQLKDFMEKHKLNSAGFARVLGVTPQAVNLWLKGDRRVNGTVVKCCTLFNANPQFISYFRSIAID